MFNYKGEEAASQQAALGTETPSLVKKRKVNLNRNWKMEELKKKRSKLKACREEEGNWRAGDIIDHREANGKFKSVDELRKVSEYWR